MGKRRQSLNGRSRRVLGGCLLLTCLFPGNADADPPGHLTPARCTTPPIVDGQLDDACWRGAVRFSDFSLPRQTVPAAKKVEAIVGYDAERLYMAFTLEEPHPDRLRMRHREDHPDVWQDDVIEIFLRSGGDRMAIDQLLVNAAGARWSLRRHAAGHTPWPPDWPAATHIAEDHWTAELAVPFAALGIAEASPGRLLEVKFGREDYADEGVSLSVWPPGSVYAGIDGYALMFLGEKNLLSTSQWTGAKGSAATGPDLRLGRFSEISTVARVRPRIPLELIVNAEGRGRLRLDAGSDPIVRTVEGSGSVRWNGVSPETGDFPLRLTTVEGSLDLSLHLNESPNLSASGTAIPVEGGHPLRIEHVAVADARAVRGFIGTPFDGTMGSRGWNGQVWEYPQAGAGAGVGYAYHSNDGMHVRLVDEAGFDAVQIRGGIRARMYAPAVSYRGPAASNPLHEFQGRTLRSRVLFEERVETSSVSFTDVTDGVIADAAFFRLAPARRDDTAQVHWPLGTTWTAQTVTGIDAIGITFEADQAPSELTLIVTDPLDPRLQLMTVDIEVSGDGPGLVVLDIIDQILPAGTPLAVTAVDGDGNRWTKAEVRLYTMPIAQARDEALRHRKFLVKTFFACLSEPRPWTGLPRQGSLQEWFDRHPMGDQLSQLFAAVDDGLQIEPFDETLRQYEQWLHRNRTPPDLDVPVLAPDDAAAPEWARWARAAWLAARRVPAWWLEHRVVETGEFGGAVGDDTDLYQNFVDFAFLESGGVAAQLRDAAARLAHLAELTTLTDGINRDTMDPLHAYEEGLNQEALMAAWTYGDPVYLERCMAAARSVAEVTTVTPLGHRHFRSQLIGRDARNNPATDTDGQAHPSMWHPALEVLWFNQHPLIRRWLDEWGGGWLDHFEPGRYAHAVDVASETVEGVNSRPLYGGYGGQGSAFAFLAMITGNRAYAGPFFEIYAAGQTSTSPSDLVLDLYHRFGADAFGEGLDRLPLSGPAAAVLHADPDVLVEAFRSDVAEMEGFDLMYTSSEPFTDRVFLRAIRNAAICYTGGSATRNKFNRSHAVSWSGFGTDYAAFVEAAGPDRFRARLYNFEGAPLRGSVRFWQLDHGRYRICQGPDADDDGQIDNVSRDDDVVLRRGDPISVELPAGGSVLSVELIEALPSLQAEADLALSPLDLTIDGASISGFVHNIGRQPAAARLMLIPSGDGAPRQLDLGTIEASDDLQPRRLPFRFVGLSAAELDGVIRVDPDHDVLEITEENNSIHLRDVYRAMQWKAEVESAITRVADVD